MDGAGQGILASPLLANEQDAFPGPDRRQGLPAHLLRRWALADDIVQGQPRLGPQDLVHELMHLGHGPQGRDERQGLPLRMPDDAQTQGDIVLLAIHLETSLHIVQLLAATGGPGDAFRQRDVVHQGPADDQCWLDPEQSSAAAVQVGDNALGGPGQDAF